jgi:hypothetical protein
MKEKLPFDEPGKESEEILGDFLSDAERQGIIEKPTIKLSESQLADVKEKMLDKLRSGKFAEMEKLQGYSGASEDIYQSSEMQQAAMETMLWAIKEGDVELFDRIEDKFNMPISIREETKFLEAAKQTMRECFLTSMLVGDDSYTTAREIQEAFKIPENEIEQPCKLTDEIRSLVIYKIEHDEFRDVANIRSHILNLREIYDDPDIKEAANKKISELFERSLSNGRYNGAGKHVNYISEKDLGKIYLLKNKFKIDIDALAKEEKYIDCAKNSLDSFNGGNYTEIIPIAEIRDVFSSSKQIVDSSDEIIKNSHYVDDFNQVKTILGRNHCPTDNASVFRIIAKAGNDWPVLGQTLQYYKLSEIEEKLDEGGRLADIWQTGAKEELPQKEISHFEDVFAYLGDSVKNIDKKKIAEFGKIQDNQQRLTELGKMNSAEACECVKKFGLNKGAYDYLSRRLTAYKNMISGEAVKKNYEYGEGKFNPIKNRNEKILILCRIKPSEINPESVKSGLLRDIYYAAMQGTPEMAAVKIATNNINKEAAENNKSSKIRSVVKFWGYHSGIYGESIGQYKPLTELYQKCRKQIERKYAGQELDEDQVEHQSVLLATTRLERAYSYCGLLQDSASPYAPSFDEAIAAGQLGRKVMRQMAGMRKKIQDTDFSNIARFIGKSGNNKYGKEKREIEAAIDYLKEENQENNKIRMVEEENNLDVEKLERNHKQTAEQLNLKNSKIRKEIQESDIPSNEKELQLINFEQRTVGKTKEINQEYEKKLEYLQNRTPEQLLADLAARKEIIDKRFEKRKSLAQKALDLHFAFNHLGGNGDEKSKLFADIIDWINDAPYGTIKRAHKMMNMGIERSKIMELAIQDMLAKQNVESGELEKIGKSLLNELDNLNNDRNQKDKIRDSFEQMDYSDPKCKKANDDYWAAEAKFYQKRQEIKNLLKISSILSRRQIKASFEEMAEMAAKNTEGLKDALDVFSLEEIKYLIGNDIHLVYATQQKNEVEAITKSRIPVEILKRIIEHPGGVELVKNTLDRGFSIDEITRFPHLASSLIEK